MALRGRNGWVWLSGLSFALAGCELSRPPDAYDASYPSTSNDAGLDFDMIDSGTARFDAGHADFFGGDAGDGGDPTVVPPADPKLAELVGGYLMRIDDYATASSVVNPGTATEVTISVRSRASYMAAALITAQADGKLVSMERLCHQTYAFDCTKTCQDNSTKTTIFPGADALFPTLKPVSRALTLSDQGSLAAAKSSMFAGFDTKMSSTLPTSDSDPRVWDANRDATGLEGLLTQAVIVAKVALLTKTADCRLSIVEELQSSWKADLDKSGEAYVLDGKTITLAREDLKITSKVLRAIGSQDATNADCQGDSSANTESVPGKLVLRFFKVDPSKITSSCPSVADYDRNLAPENP